jgi:uracil phosphoribosyltransferase
MNFISHISICLLLIIPTYAYSTNEHKFLNLTILNHPVIQHNLTIMRDKTTDSKNFRAALDRITYLMAYEITKNLNITDKLVKTPICKTISKTLNEKIVLVPIMRAGFGMLDAMLHILPDSSVGYIGLYRDHITKQPVEYLIKLPTIHKQLFIILDPMLATGSSLIYATKKLIDAGVRQNRIIIVSLLATPEGVRSFHSKYPSINIMTASLDEKLNNNAYIVPGLGDAGDRLYGN